MLSFLLAFPNFDLLLKSCHLFFPASKSFFALIFLNFFAGGPSSPFSPAACGAFGYMLAAADMTPPFTAGADGGGGAALDDDDGGGGGGGVSYGLWGREGKRIREGMGAPMSVGRGGGGAAGCASTGV